MRRFTRAFCVSILCVTLSALALRLTVFSDMAVAADRAVSSMMTGEDGVYELRNRVYFATAGSKGDFLIENHTEDRYIKVNIVLEDSGDSVFSTGFIDPGGTLPADRLNPEGQLLEDGQYDCIAQVVAYDLHDVRTVMDVWESEIEIYIGEKPKRK